MSLIKDLIAAAGPADAAVREVVAGPDWIMVTSAGSGVAARPHQADGITVSPESSALGEAFLQKSLKHILALAASTDRLKASLGVAGLNSALAAGYEAAMPRSFSIPRARGKTVAVVGRFGFIEDLRRIAGRVIVMDTAWIDRRPAGAESDTGPYATSQADMASADMAIIRGSTLIGGTLQSWLDRARHCYTVVYGPSTPLSPVLFEYGADQLVGIRIEKADIAAEWIRNGRENLLACPGVRSLVLGRDQQSR